MKSKLNAWAFLRPLLIAVAAAASWVALSATGASADSSTSGDPLRGAAGSTLSSVASTATHQARDVLEPAEAGPVEDTARLANQLVQLVPAVNTAVPAGTVSAVVDPALDTVDGAAGGTVGTVIPLAGAVLEPLEPVLDPVINAVPLPGVTPAAPPAEAPALPADIPLPGEGATAPAAEPQQANTGPDTASAPPLSHRTRCNTGLACDSRLQPAAATALVSVAAPQDAPFGGQADVLPCVPGAATGGSSPSGGNGQAMPARLGDHRFHAPGAGPDAVQGRLLAAPAPVPSDPGSSPD